MKEQSKNKKRSWRLASLSLINPLLYMRQKKRKKNMTNEQKMAAQRYPGPAEPSWGPWGSQHFPSGDCPGGFLFVANAVM